MPFQYKENASQELEVKLEKMEKNLSPFESAVRELELPAVSAFKQLQFDKGIQFVSNGTNMALCSEKEIQSSLPHLCSELKGQVLHATPSQEKVKNKKIAVLFSGGPAPGGHNVLLGIKAALGKDNILYGVNGGPKGLIKGHLFMITADMLSHVRNTGGFDLLGSDRTKIKTEEQYKKVLDTVKKFSLDGIIVIGGDDSNTNAAFLAEYLYDHGCKVIGIPKTIDGDLQVGQMLPITFGFDTATKIYAELVGNILQDTPSSRKYWHFVKLMGRAASHVALEVALKTRPSIVLISEEVAKKKMSLNEIVEYIAGIIAYRAGKGIDYGVVIIPEGLIEFIPEFHDLISELNDVLSTLTQDLSGMTLFEQVCAINISSKSAKLLQSLPEDIAKQLLLDRDSHGNLQVSQIPTERLLIQMVKMKIKEMKNNPDQFFKPGRIELTQEEIHRFQSSKFQTNNHFFGYEGRCGAPTRFDAIYTYNLGITAGALVLDGKTGYMVAVTDFDTGGKPLAIPLLPLLNKERRQGKDELVIKKALVDLNSPAFRYLQKRRHEWSKQDLFTSPGPRQYWGPTKHQMPFTVALNQGYDDFYFNFEEK